MEPKDQLELTSRLFMALSLADRLLDASSDVERFKFYSLLQVELKRSLRMVKLKSC
jgi:hypothetical protein